MVNQTSTSRREFARWLATAGAGTVIAALATAFASPDDDSARRLARRQRAHRRDRAARECAKSFEFRILTDENRWHLVRSTPEYQEHDRLVTLRNQHSERMASLIDKLLDIPAKTEAGRQAKADVAICCVLDLRDLDDEVGWRVKTTRRLLLDLVGGEAGKNMRRQFA
jgi:hypothetical protein